MDPNRNRQRNLLIRNVVGAVGLLLLGLLVMVWMGVFEGEQSDEAKVRRLIEAAQDEINDHDWDDFLRLCDVTPEEADIWRRSIPRQAELVAITVMEPRGLIAIDLGATEYSIDVTVIARLDLPIAGGLRAQTETGRMHFIKVGEVWKIDLNKTSGSFPHVPRPKLPPRA